MPFIYCTQCGYKNVFTTRQAKFCAGCGNSLVQTQTDQVSEASVTESVEVEPEQASFSSIRKLEYDIDPPSKNFTVGDLINTQKEGSNQNLKKAQARQAPTKLTREEAEAESMRVCGSSIQNKSTE